MNKVGFIGLGKMGSSICRNIINQNYPVICFDINEQHLIEFQDGAVIAKNSSEVFMKSDITFLSLPSSVEVESLTNEFLKFKETNKTVIDLSTSYPFSTMGIYKKFKEKGWGFADASITGTPKHAESGDVILLFGGDKEVYEENSDILKSFSKKTHYMGRSGTGNIAKLINNYLAIMYDILYAEIFPFAKKLDMDVQKLYDVIGESGVSCELYKKAGKQIVDKNFQLNFSMDLALKDLNYVKKMHEDLNAPSFVLDGGLNLLKVGKECSSVNSDITFIAQIVEKFFDKE